MKYKIMVEGFKMTIFEYKFSDGTTFRLLNSGFSENEKFNLSSLHGDLICVRIYPCKECGK